MKLYKKHPPKPIFDEEQGKLFLECIYDDMHKKIAHLLFVEGKSLEDVAEITNYSTRQIQRIKADTMKYGLKKLANDKAVLIQLISGEWVDCDAVQKALGIDFGTGMKLFEFGRTAEWNPAPLNGQKITTKFRLKRP